MWRQWIPVLASRVSPQSGDVDLLFAGLLFASALVLGLLFFLLTLFCVRYRACNRDRPRTPRPQRAGIGR